MSCVFHIAASCWIVVGMAVAPMTVFADQSIDSQVEREIREGMFLGAVVMVGRPGEVLYHQAYGERDHGQPMRRDSLFDVASVTKAAATATALAVTMSRNQTMSLDDPMHRYLPGMTGAGGEEISIRHTATHRSGIDNTKQLSKQYEGEELIRRILSRDVKWPVGSRRQYSCLGIIRLSEMIAAINGQPFDTFCRENIFEPLEMSDTRFGPVDPSLRHRCVKFRPRTVGLPSDPNTRSIGRPVGNAGLFTTARDLAKIATLWLEEGQADGVRLFDPEIGRRFTAEGIVWLTGGSRNVPDLMSPKTYYHTGYTGQSLLVDPEAKGFVIVLTNWSHRSVEASNQASDAARTRIAELLFERYLLKSP